MLESLYVFKWHFSQTECSKVCLSFSQLNHHCSDNFNAKPKTNTQISSVTMKFHCLKFKQNCITDICTKYHEDSMKGPHLYRINLTLNDDLPTLKLEPFFTFERNGHGEYRI